MMILPGPSHAIFLMPSTCLICDVATCILAPTCPNTFVQIYLIFLLAPTVKLLMMVSLMTTVRLPRPVRPTRLWMIPQLRVTAVMLIMSGDEDIGDSDIFDNEDVVLELFTKS